jgi:hypothetical protein
MPRSRLPVPKPVKSFSFTSAWSSPSLSLRKTMCGAQATMMPPFADAMP